MARLVHFLHNEQWAVELKSLPTFRAFVVKSSRVIYLAVRGFLRDQCMFRASALTYITMLSLVPLLAFAFSVAKGLGAYGDLRSGTIDPFLERTFGVESVAEAVGMRGSFDQGVTTLAEGGDGAQGDASSAQGGAATDPNAAAQPLEAGSNESLEKLRGAIDNALDIVEGTDVSSLGLFGLAILLFTVIKLLSAIERSFNEIWDVRRSRRLVRKVADYLSIVILVPILLVTATGISAVFERAAGELNISFFYKLVLASSSFLAIWVGFACIYLFMPNTKVRLSSALLGGVFGGSLWQLAQVGHVKFQIGMANFNALYSGFAALPIFMIWVWVSWLTVLLGAELASAHQSEPGYRDIVRSRDEDHAFRQIHALRAVMRVTRAFLRGDPPRTVPMLADEVGCSQRSTQALLAPLRDAGIIVFGGEEREATVLLGRDPSQVTVKEVLDALRGDLVAKLTNELSEELALVPDDGAEGSGTGEQPGAVRESVDVVDQEILAALTGMELDRTRSEHNRSLRELAEAALGAEREAYPAPRSHAESAGAASELQRGEARGE